MNRGDQNRRILGNMTENADHKRLRALIGLLDDPDDRVFNQVRDEIFSMGEDAIPDLERYWEFRHGEVDLQERLENLIHEIQFSTVKEGLEKWVQQPDDLLQGAYLINKYQFPDLEKQDLIQGLDSIAKKIWLELSDNLSAERQVMIMNHFLFEDLGFKGNKKHFHNPQNSFLSEVLESKKGNPLSLSLIYILVAERLGIPIRGVNLPNHFIVAYCESLQPDSEIKFYLNPFSKGTWLTRKDLQSFLKQLEIEEQPAFFETCSNEAIIRRMVVNLIYSYSRLGYQDKIDDLQELESVFHSEP